MAAVNTRAEKIKEQDWRFAELVMRTWIEPQLADRYREDPVGTLAQFGIFIRSEEEAPELRTGLLDEVSIRVEDLDHPSEQVAAIPSFR
ncbi:hypothetical protein [Streptosporangium sp. NBC_01756]|uniref:hypothetical protein n=1 Tax=Streptosporangium sp. NBC_01756 TaxID=2975950 RepID=UPI002DD8C348|nr:hypothetical protein [Streptosporangium sp. NBC_01756]WSC85351.1 hypothetical protein OIE48_34120 [Streptosporangium sp. NBC_01756]